MLFFISETSLCFYSIRFLECWHSHFSNFCSLWIQASHYNRQCLIGYNRADRKALLDINQNTCIQRKWLYTIFLQGRQRKNIGRLLRNFCNFELASKCEVLAKADMDISLSSCKKLSALCLVQKLKASLPPSKQVLLPFGYVYEICGRNSVQPIVAYETMGGFLTVRYFQWMRSFR